MLKEHTFTADVVTINYAEGPSYGSPLVLLHGGGDRWQDFLPILPHLVMRWHVYALDMRGHGKSGRAPGRYRPEHYADDITMFVESQLTEPVIFFGHSLGGWIALLAAVELGKKVRALILGDPPLNVERHVAEEGSEKSMSWWRTLRALVGSGLSVPELASALEDLPVSIPGQDTLVRYGDLPGIDATRFRSLAKKFTQVDPDAMQYHAEGRMDEFVEKVDMDAALSRVTCPVLLLQGDPSQGGMNSDSDVKHALSLLPDGLSVKLESCGHAMGLNTWNVTPLLRAVIPFLESL